MTAVVGIYTTFTHSHLLETDQLSREGFVKNIFANRS